jgi:two-component system, cell cycle sensor histidine kinase and response regulator CckA
MNSLFQLLQYKIWERGKGPANLYRWLLIISLAALYAAFFQLLYETFGNTARVFPALYLAIAALSWGLPGAILITVLNTILDILLYHYHGYIFEGGPVGPMGCLFAVSLVGMLSDFVRQLDDQCSERKKMESVMHNRETRYRTIINTISEGVMIMDTNLTIVDLNENAARMYGYAKEELKGATPAQFLPSHHAGHLKLFVESIEKTGSFPSEVMNLRKDGALLYVDIRGMTVELGGEKHYLAVIRDVTQRIQADRELRESEEKFRQLFNMESDAILMVDNDTHQILEVNESACTLYGYSREELLKMQTYDISSEPDATQLAIKTKQEKIPNRYHRKKDGTVFPVEISIGYFNWRGRSLHVSAIRDISSRMAAEEEKRFLEAQFHEAQKMESIGTLAGGIAHDFNNLLMSIMGNSTLALMNLQPDDPCCAYLKNIKRISNSGATLAKQLLGFARGGKYEPKPTNLNELVSYQNQLFGRTYKNLTIHEDFESNLWCTEVDRGQIEQVLLNIYVNSQQAMPEGGSIFVKTENSVIGKDTVLPFPCKKGEYVKLSIRDTGIGMDAATQKRIFEPFFTTKEKGRGTGLGMASVYGIVKNHAGYIDVTSKLGKGTTISILLPVTDKELPVSVQPVDEKIAKGSGTILLVDDEEAITEVTLQMIESLGYRVISACGGREAVKLYKERKEPIDLVILDIIMPEMGGGETFDRLKEIDPDVNVLISTGYSIDENAAKIMARGAKDFLQKPFDMEALSKKIEKALG